MWVDSPCYIGFTDATKPDNRSPKFSTSAGRLQQSGEAPKLGAFFGCWSPVPEGSLLSYRRVLGATIFPCGALPLIIKGKGGSRNPAQAQATYLDSQSSWWSLAWIFALNLLDWSYSTKNVLLELRSLSFLTSSSQSFVSYYTDEYFLFACLFFKA